MSIYFVCLNGILRYYSHITYIKSTIISNRSARLYQSPELSYAPKYGKSTVHELLYRTRSRLSKYRHDPESRHITKQSPARDAAKADKQRHERISGALYVYSSLGTRAVASSHTVLRRIHTTESALIPRMCDDSLPHLPVFAIKCCKRYTNYSSFPFTHKKYCDIITEMCRI